MDRREEVSAISPYAALPVVQDIRKIASRATFASVNTRLCSGARAYSAMLRSAVQQHCCFLPTKGLSRLASGELLLLLTLIHISPLTLFFQEYDSSSSEENIPILIIYRHLGTISCMSSTHRDHHFLTNAPARSPP